MGGYDPLGLISGQFAEIRDGQAALEKSFADHPLDDPEYSTLLTMHPGVHPVPPADKVPETFGEMRDAFMLLIWKQRASLKGTALVQALTALSRLAELDHEKPADDRAHIDVLDLIQTDGVLPQRKKELLEAELLTARDRLIRIDEELTRLEAQP